MRTSLSLEAIDDHIVQRYRNEPRRWPAWKEKPPSPWCAKIHGLSKQYGYDREFLDATKDYQDANRSGSRGVMFYWALEDGIYEVQELRPRKKPRRYFGRVSGGHLSECDETEVRAWLLENAILELTCLLRRNDELLGPSTLSAVSALVSLAEKTQESCCTS